MASLEFKNITKIFPGVRALDNVGFTAKSGEVLALLEKMGPARALC